MKKPFDKNWNFSEGCVIAVDKPLGWTSTDVVRKIKYMLIKNGYKKLKIGHAGTLDPLASGVLLICTGRATKQIETLQSGEKEYTAELRLGATTASYDMEHPVNAEYPWEHITRTDLEAALVRLTGERLQMPPLYSAKKIDGQRAYEYAREGEEVKLRAAQINIYEIRLLEYELPRIKISVRCSKGTYIRSLAREIGEEVQSGAYLTSLCRTRSGDYSIDDTYSMDEIISALTPSAARNGSGNDPHSAA